MKYPVIMCGTCNGLFDRDGNPTPKQPDSMTFQETFPELSEYQRRYLLAELLKVLPEDEAVRAALESYILSE